MKKCIIILLMAATLGGCLPEGDAGCPEYLTLSFDMLDQHDKEGTFDSRIANDVQVYVFRDGKVVHDLIIPYEEIRNDGKYTFRKTLRMHGDLDLVAWAVASGKGDPSSIPDWIESDELAYLYLEMPARTGPTDCRPTSCELYHGMISFSEVVDVSSSHNISLQNIACRLEVNVTGASSAITSTNPRVAVHGSMTRMNMELTGIGDAAVVHTRLVGNTAKTDEYNTGRFGILSSAEYQTLAVEVYDDNKLLETLTVPRDNLPRGAQAGDLMIFDYRLGDTEFWVTVNGFRQKIVIIDGM